MRVIGSYERVSVQKTFSLCCIAPCNLSLNNRRGDAGYERLLLSNDRFIDGVYPTNLPPKGCLFRSFVNSFYVNRLPGNGHILL